MKKVVIFIILLLISIISACSDNTSGVTNPGTGGLGGLGGIGRGGNTGGNVTFTIGTTDGQQGGILFYATPSAAVKITQVTISLPAQQFNDILTDNGTTVYNANEAVGLREYTGIEAGQQWTFKFEGTLASNNTAFTVTSNYTVQ
jgi:hypothetical protein